MEKRFASRIGLSLLALFLLFSAFLPVSGEEQRLPSDSLTKEKRLDPSIAVKIQLTPLARSSLLDAETIRLIEEESHVYNHLNPAIKIFDPNLYFRLHKLHPTRTHSTESTLFTASLVASVALNSADYFSTMKAIRYEGLREANPLMKPFTKNAVLFAAVKAGLTIYHFHFMKSLYKKDKKLAWAVSLVFNFAMAYIVANNLRMIRQAQRI